MIDSKSIQPGSKVTMHFSIVLEDGTIAETTEGDAPFEFVLGDGSLIQGLELALFGLNPGDQQSLKIGASEGFGARDDAAIQILPRSDFPEEMEIEEGQIIGFTTPSGEELAGAVKKIQKDDITIDFNHPFAGHEIQFNVHILEVTPPGVKED